MPFCKIPEDLCPFECERKPKLGYAGNTDVPGAIVPSKRATNAKYNRGLGFSIKQRQFLGLHGLLPAVVRSTSEQISATLALLDRFKHDVDKSMFLYDLADRNQFLFYKLLEFDIAKMMPLVYTPTVGSVCQMYSALFQKPRGMFITIKDKGHVSEVLKNWPERDVRAIVVTDGERILGLGDLGANGMGIPIGKLVLYTALGGIKPHMCLPITLDVGTNTASTLADRWYIGLQQQRATGSEYDEFIDEFMRAAVQRFGRHCLIQFEDFGNANAFRLLEKYREHYCTFNDDIQGTAAIAVAGLMASLRITKKQLKDHLLLFQGAGEAAIGIARLCVLVMVREGLTVCEARQRIWLFDSKGLVVRKRPAGGLTEHKQAFAHRHEPIDELADAVRQLQPSVLIGASAIAGAFTQEILEGMAEWNEMPIIFALSNPTAKSECTAMDAYTYTKGKCIFASGSPFPPVEYQRKTYYPGQCNNAYIFPGIALGVLCAGMLTVPDEVFYLAAETLADLCTPDDLAKRCLFPPLSKISCCSIDIAKMIVNYAYISKQATVFPEPLNKEEFIKSQMYNLECPPAALPKVHLKESY